MMQNGWSPNSEKPQQTKMRRLTPYPVTNHEGLMMDGDVPVCNILSIYVLSLFALFALFYLFYYYMMPGEIKVLVNLELHVDNGNEELYSQVYAERIKTLIHNSQTISPTDKSVYTQRRRPRRCGFPHLQGPLNVNASHSHDDITLNSVIEENSDVEFGGKWQPKGCSARHRVAIIIPYRDRLHHLVVLLAHLLPILRRQELNFRVFVVEQFGNATFNKGIIMNAAFKEALKIFDFQCIVFHDVDLIPEDDRNMYSCPWQPRHMSVAIDEMDYRLKYDILVGGVLNLRLEHYQQLNGYSNMYWGWGAEDDDMAYRILHVGLKITRPPSTIARYKMIKHQKRRPTSWHTRSKLLHTAVKRYKMDGLNSVIYKLVFIHEERLFTHIMVDVGKP